MSRRCVSYPNVQVTKGLAGWFAVYVWWNPEFGGFAEPYETGVGRYALQLDAIEEGKLWAEEMDVPFYLPEVLEDAPARQDVANQIKGTNSRREDY